MPNTTFPTTLDAPYDPQPGDVQGATNPTHSGQHRFSNDAIVALEGEVGTRTSSVTTSLRYITSSLSALVLSSAAAALVLATPVSGSGAPALRSLVASDHVSSMHDAFGTKGTEALPVYSDTGQLIIPSNTGGIGAGLSIINGKLTNTASNAGSAAGYYQIQFPSNVNRIGASFAFTPGVTTGAVCLAIWSGFPIAYGGTVPNSGCHFAIEPTGWIYGSWTGNVFTSIQTGTFATPCVQDGATVYTCDISIYGNTARILLPDGTAISITNPIISANAGVYSNHEVYQNNASTETKGAFVKLWADTQAGSDDMYFVTPGYLAKALTNFQASGSFAQVVASSVTDTSLTPTGGIVFAGAGGVLKSVPALQYNSNQVTPALTLGSNTATNVFFEVDRIAGYTAGFVYYTAGFARWFWQMGSDAESGSNAGSSLQAVAYTDAGTYGDTPLSIGRAIGSTLALGGTGRQLVVTGGTLTASAPVTLSQTWNNAAVSFVGLDVAITAPASAGGSMVANFTVGGGSVFSVNQYGVISCTGGLNTSYTISQSATLNGASIPGIAITQTWNTASVVTAAVFNAINTASAAGSRVIDVQINGATKFNIDNTGAANLLGPIKHTGTSMGFFSAAAVAQVTGYGTPTGGSHQGSFAAGSMTLAQACAALAQLIIDLKSYGIVGT